MLGAQALRTKQKVERKEKEKRQKERVRNAELQRERLQKVASEDASGHYDDAPLHPAVPPKHHQRLSVSAVHQHRVTASSHDDDGRRSPSPTPISAPALPPARSPSSDFAADRMHGHTGHNGQTSAGGRLMKFLGLSSNASHQLSEQERKKEAKRRLSTY